ncbi:hypothetical protein [Magnetococcus marinus]|nr:hypothetical protein [Magnetococcus marinus]
MFRQLWHQARQTIAQGCCVWHALVMALAVMVLGQGTPAVSAPPQPLATQRALYATTLVSRLYDPMLSQRGVVGEGRWHHRNPSLYGEAQRRDVPRHTPPLYTGVEPANRHR